MINFLITWSVKNRLLVLVATLFLAVAGIKAVFETPVDAIPDLSENQVTVYADWPGRSPREVEDQITYPLSLKLHGMPGVKDVRATSMLGFSIVTVIFGDTMEVASAREKVLERLNLMTDLFPSGVTPKLGPDASGLGWVYQYYLEVDAAKSPNGRGYDLGELRSVQDGFIRPQIDSVPGVAETASIGGFVAQYQIEVDSQKMRDAEVTLTMVLEAVKQSNLNVGGKTIEENGMEFVVRGLGIGTNITDFENIVVTTHANNTVFLKDIARIEFGGDFRRGTLDAGGLEVVGGMVVMGNRENAREVIDKVKNKIAQISPSLPPGITIKSFYDRSELIDLTLGTLKTSLLEEILLVVLAHIIFLGHYRSILIVTLPLPASILFFIFIDGAIRHHFKHHEPFRDCHCDRRAGGCRYCAYRERHPPL